MGYLMSAQTIAGLANALDYGKSWLYPPAPPDAQPADKGAGAGADKGAGKGADEGAGKGAGAAARTHVVHTGGGVRRETVTLRRGAENASAAAPARALPLPDMLRADASAPGAADDEGWAAYMPSRWARGMWQGVALWRAGNSTLAAEGEAEAKEGARADGRTRGDGKRGAGKRGGAEAGAARPAEEAAAGVSVGPEYLYDMIQNIAFWQRSWAGAADAPAPPPPATEPAPPAPPAGAPSRAGSPARADGGDAPGSGREGGRGSGTEEAGEDKVERLGRLVEGVFQGMDPAGADAAAGARAPSAPGAPGEAAAAPAEAAGKEFALASSSSG
jgi:hypothetical protein